MHDISGGRSPLVALVFWVGLCVLVGLISGLMTRREISGLVCGFEKAVVQSAELDLRTGVDCAVHFDGRGRMDDYGCQTGVAASGI